MCGDSPLNLGGLRNISSPSRLEEGGSDTQIFKLVVEVSNEGSGWEKWRETCQNQIWWLKWGLTWLLWWLGFIILTMNITFKYSKFIYRAIFTPISTPRYYKIIDLRMFPIPNGEMKSKSINEKRNWFLFLWVLPFTYFLCVVCRA